MKHRINELETKSKKKKKKKNRGMYTGISEFKKKYQPRRNRVKDVKGDLLADSHSILNRCKNYLCQLLNGKGTATHTDESLVPEPSSFETEAAIEKMKYINRQELIKFWQKCFNHEVIRYVLRYTQLLIVHKGLSLLPTTYRILSNIHPSRLTPYVREITGDQLCRFRHNRSTADQVFCIR
jgi:hypothetical protein